MTTLNHVRELRGRWKPRRTPHYKLIVEIAQNNPRIERAKIQGNVRAFRAC